MGNKRKGVNQVSESSVEITFTLKGTRCRERIKCKPTPANLRRVENHRTAIIAAINNGTFDYATSFPDSKNALKFSAYKGAYTKIEPFLNDWLNEKKKSIKASTLRDYEKTIKYQLIPEFGSLSICELSRSHIREWCNKKTCSIKRINNIISPLRVALQEAVYDGVIETSPLYNWQYKRNEAPVKKKDKIDPFSKEELKAILNSLDGQGKNLIQIIIDTGIRTSEAVALEWDDVDFIHNTIHIWKAKTEASKIAERPKTIAGDRLIPLPETAMNALKRQKEHTFLSGSIIFNNPRTDTPWTGDQQIRKTLWHPALKKAGVRYRYPYQLRHTFASMRIMKAESIGELMSIAHIMGHSTWVFTSKVYARFLKDEFYKFTDAGSIPKQGT